MTNKEAIGILKIALDEVEWGYDLEYAIAINKAIKVLKNLGHEYMIFQQNKSKAYYPFWLQYKDKTNFADFTPVYYDYLKTEETNSKFILEEIFHKFAPAPEINISWKQMLTNEFQTMSGGDIVYLDGDYYWCEPEGWTLITNEVGDSFEKYTKEYF